ncbi:MAG: FecR domain-containing protein [Phycisphaerae bacterium]|nr:FecR domain-containing protein [Phycisphaerae bacterium]
MNDVNKYELCRLIVAMQDETISQQEFVLLQELLRNDFEARKVYYDFLISHIGLSKGSNAITHLQFAQESQSQQESDVFKEVIEDQIELQILESQKKELEKSQTVSHRTTVNQRSRSTLPSYKSIFRVGGGIAAMIFVAFLLTAAERFVAQSKFSRVAIAEIVEQMEVVWDSSTEFKQGGKIYPGDLKLSGGWCKIKMKSGVDLILQGKVDITLESQSSVYLHSGKVFAEIDGDNGLGFKVRTPTMSAIDLGTGFAVSVDENDNSELHVYDGQVCIVANVDSEEKNREYVSSGQAKRVKAGTDRIDAIEFNQFAFDRAVPSAYELAVKRLKPVEYWRFEESVFERFVSDINTINLESSYPTSVAFTEGPSLGEGVKNRALYLDGQNSFADIKRNIPIISDNPDGYTYCFWLYFEQSGKQMIILEKMGVNNNYRVLSLDEDDRLTHSYITSNPWKSFPYNTKQPLEKSQWYFVAITGHIGKAKNIYINGKDQSNKTVGNLASTPVNLPVMQIGQSDEIPQSIIGRSFIGAVDELAIFNRVLNEQEIQHLYDCAVGY